MSSAVEAEQRGRRNSLLRANDNSSADECWRPRNFCSLWHRGKAEGARRSPQRAEGSSAQLRVVGLTLTVLDTQNQLESSEILRRY